MWLRDARGTYERELRPGLRVLVEEPLDLVGRRRAAEEIALAEAAAHLPEALGLGGMLDPLGHRREPERVAEPQDRVDERFIRAVADELVDERLRDLQRLDRELGETAQRRVARAEVVDRQPDAELAKRRIATSAPSLPWMTPDSVTSITIRLGSTP